MGSYLRRYGEREAPAREPDGEGLLVGLASTFDYDTRRLAPAWDRVASVGFAGPTLEVDARRGFLALRARLSAAYAFAQVTSLAYAEAAPEFADVFIKSELQLRGYYYGQGFVSYGSVEGEIGALRLTFDGRMTSYWSFNGDDTKEPHLAAFLDLLELRYTGSGPQGLFLALSKLLKA